MWAVKLFLADATGNIAALLWGADADKFFGGAGLQACDLSHTPEVLLACNLSVFPTSLRVYGATVLSWSWHAFTAYSQAERRNGAERIPRVTDCSVCVRRFRFSVV